MGTDVRIEYVRQIVQDNLLFFASLAQVNDPLDCKPLISLNGGTRDEQLGFLEKGVAKQHPDWRPEDVKQEAMRLLAIDPAELDRQITSQWKDFIEGEVFICCFSQAGNDLSLFSSAYGDFHKGVCLEFRTTDKDFAALRQVEYTNDRDTFYVLRDQGPERTKKLFFKKLKRWNANDWERECEWRLVNNQKGHHEFPPQLLTKITLGKDIHPEAKDRILSWIDNRTHPLDLCQAKLSPDGGSLDLDLLKRIP